ncbi:5-formyltetrahydrofolate cyclo-ligase [Aurantiacibacter zhengii]|uniref:5-formyltetrahydrofolate cyclo-ligase n=1 Tax=Aurantiacibacter zhengii TaxID=2307003 RepID=UPI0018F71A1F|nr:5-formyltetrahydrofolate cyclo-ligase [Aurantiacibacter zhengii]
MTDISEQKTAIRKTLRKARQEHAAALPSAVSALVFRAPPAPVREIIPAGATIGLYRAGKGEAPAGGYARYFMEAGHTIALPRIASLDEPMQFHEHTDPYGESDLTQGRMGLMQPAAAARVVEPDVLFVPLVGFTERGDRIGQGGGFYDRWLAAHPDTLAIGLAWDVQRVDSLPTADHDMALSLVITPTRIYGPF